MISLGSVSSVRKQLLVLSCLILSLLCYILGLNLSASARQAAHILQQGGSDTKSHLLPPLVPLALDTLPLGSVQASGWMRDQMLLMRHGLAGHLYEFYNYVRFSSWLGGDQEYSALNEGFPYWFNGIVPLAYALNDPALKAQVHEAAREVLKRQADDGWLGPEMDGDRLLWARFPVCLGFTQLADADADWVKPIVESLYRFVKLMHKMLTQNGTGYSSQGSGNWSSHMLSWGRVRGHDMIIVLQWLYEHHRRDQVLLLQTMRMLYDLGLKWDEWYSKAYFELGIDRDLYNVPEATTLPHYHYLHGVNIAQGFKAPAVVRRFTNNHILVKTAMDGVNWTMTYHGAASGTIIADERIDGLSPHSGSELCTSVETIFSLAYLYHATGMRQHADMAELAAFNSFPAMMSPDMWSHQYVAAANQPNAMPVESPFYNTNNFSQTFGLEPHYPCCTVNHAQGLPKYLSHSFVKLGRNGIAHALLGPAIAKIKLSSHVVTIEATTMYPFADTIDYRIQAKQAFDLHLRIPAWAGPATNMSVLGSFSIPIQPHETTGLQRLAIGAGTTTVRYHIDTSLRTKVRPNETVSVYVGALLYALEVKSTNTSFPPRQYRHPEHFYHKDYAPDQVRDWQLHSSSTWNYAIDPKTLVMHTPPRSSGHMNPVTIWHAEGDFAHVTVQGCKIDWPEIRLGVPGYAPVGAAKRCLGPAVELDLIPYGSAKTRIAEIPIIDLT